MLNILYELPKNLYLFSDFGRIYICVFIPYKNDF